MSDETKDLPAGWVWTTLGDVIRVRSGFAFKSSDYCESGAPLIRQTDLKGNIVDTNSAVRLPNNYLDIHTEFQVQRGDLLIGMSGSLGKVARYVSEEPALQNQRTGLIIHDAILDPRFIVLLLQFAEPQLLSSGKGIAVQNISAKDVEGCTIPFSPLGEQARIVAEVEKQFTRLDAGVAALNRAQANLKRYRASVLKAACEGRLVPTEAELARAEGRDYEPAGRLLACILKERRAKWEADQLAKMQAQGKVPKDDKWKEKYQEPAGPDTTDLPELPEGWRWASPEQLSASDDYALAIGPFGSNLKVSDYTEDGVPLVFVRNIRTQTFGGNSTSYISKEKAEELRPHWVSSGDILITKMGDPPGDACLYPSGQSTAVITADCIKFRPCNILSFPAYFVFAINSQVVRPQILAITKGVTQLKVSLGRFKTIAFPLPPLAEQRRIVSELERRLSVTNELEAVVAANLKRAERLRQSILKRAFEGKLVPQDPKDEPASALLERIRAERQVEQKATAKAISKPSQRSKRPQIVQTQAELFR